MPGLSREVCPVRLRRLRQPVVLQQELPGTSAGCEKLKRRFRFFNREKTEMVVVLENPETPGLIHPIVRTTMPHGQEVVRKPPGSSFATPAALKKRRYPRSSGP